MPATASPVRGVDGTHPLVVSALLFVSGACALTYQLTWLRMLRLTFGHSTAANAAVLAIFMGGLGLGAVVLGRRADRHAAPLRLYALLELGIAVSAALSPLLIDLARNLYVASGGSAEMGIELATGVRLLSSLFVLGAPTFLMGGTLSAAARAVEVEGESRWRTASLYGCNTLGAVTGVLLANFVLLEELGTRGTLLAAAAANAVLAGIAWLVSQRVRAAHAAPLSEPSTSAPSAQSAVERIVLATAAIAGAAFLLMELVWYRLLAPLLGGSTYSFGLILAVALFGIGAGGIVYALEPPSRSRTTLGRLALVTALEALFAIVPFALGDRIVFLTSSLNLLGAAGFAALALVWATITAIVALPMALVSGYQLPLLFDLMGSGRDDVGSHVGRVYAFNTGGAILASLAGGFGLIPLLGASGSWRAAVVALLALAIAGAWLSMRLGESSRRARVAIVVAVAAGLLCFSTGPTAVWRHLPIGARIGKGFGNTPNDLANVVHETERTVLWEADGVESSVAVADTDSVSLMINGKSDGNAVADASTMILTGMLPALYHPEPKRALVIGLGLGVTAGWLASVPTIERVDVVELEPAVLHAASAASAVNRKVLSNPKVHIVAGDAREFLLTTSSRYDIISSEPSNPYRAGVASLYTVEFYEAARHALAPGGVFAQWLQAYAVDIATVKTVYATIATAFDAVESWEVQLGADLLLVARERPIEHDRAALEKRLREEPYLSALKNSWGLSGVSGLYTGFIAGPEMARRIRAAIPASRLNTDDSTRIEFEFARSLGRAEDNLIQKLREAAGKSPDFAPKLTDGTIDWSEVEELRPARAIHEENPFQSESFRGSEAAMARNRARSAYQAGRLADARSAWDSQPYPPVQPIDVMMMAEVLAANADERCLPLVDQVRSWNEAEAEAILARYAELGGRIDEVATHLSNCFHAARKSGWSYRPLLRRAINMAWRTASQNPQHVEAMLEALSQPLAAMVVNDQRELVRTWMALSVGPKEKCADVLAPVEPWVWWDYEVLLRRAECYERLGSPLLSRAKQDLAAYVASAPPREFDPSSEF